MYMGGFMIRAGGAPPKLPRPLPEKLIPRGMGGDIPNLKRIDKLVAEDLKRAEKGYPDSSPPKELDFEKDIYPYFKGEKLAPSRFVEAAFRLYTLRRKLSRKGRCQPPPRFGGRQIYSAEYIYELAQSIKELGVKGKIVEICAGRGYLSKHLAALGIDVVATDKHPPSDSRGVEPLDHLEAVEKYKPALVLAEWIPEYIPEDEMLPLQAHKNEYGASTHQIDLEVIDAGVDHLLLVIAEGSGGSNALENYPHKKIERANRYSRCGQDALEAEASGRELDRGSEVVLVSNPRSQALTSPVIHDAIPPELEAVIQSNVAALIQERLRRDFPNPMLKADPSTGRIKEIIEHGDPHSADVRMKTLPFGGVHLVQFVYVASGFRSVDINTVAFHTALRYNKWLIEINRSDLDSCDNVNVRKLAQASLREMERNAAPTLTYHLF